MDRREFLKSALTLGVLGCAAKASPAFAGVETTAKQRTSGTAKSVIELWIWGGPSQLESFDPKPNAPRDYNGGHGAIPTNVDGIQVSKCLPELAKIADKYSIIRSMTHPCRGHETATYLMQTGRELGGGKQSAVQSPSSKPESRKWPKQSSAKTDKMKEAKSRNWEKAGDNKLGGGTVSAVQAPDSQAKGRSWNKPGDHTLGGGTVSAVQSPNSKPERRIWPEQSSAKKRQE